MIDAQAGITGECIPEIFPECVDVLVRMEFTNGIGPALRNEGRVGLSDLRAEKGIVTPAFGSINVEVGRHDVEVAGQDGWMSALQKGGRVFVQPLEPAELIGEFWSWCGIAIGEIETA